jgi:glycine hydroxymethyltransferase
MLLDRYRNQTHTKSNKKLYELIERQYGTIAGCEGYHSKLIKAEYQRFSNCIQLTAAQNICDRPVLAALGSILQNKTAEGSLSGRLHGGCDVINQIEAVAAERAKIAFKAQYANVQPHSGSNANLIAFKTLLKPGDTILSLDFNKGGHTSHGSNDSLTRSVYNIQNYTIDTVTFRFDYEQIYERAKEVQPKLIICGPSVYPRKVDFEKFRSIADRVTAFLLADISHTAGLIIAGAHPSPIDHAHITTTSTYKSGGPRGGLILCGNQYQMPVDTSSGTLPLFEAVELATFPGVQGTPYFNNIAAKAVFLREALSQRYNLMQFKIIKNAQKLSEELLMQGLDVMTGGTDNHMIIVDVSKLRDDINGPVAQKALENCNIITDAINLPYQSQNTSPKGLRFGTQIVSRRKMGFEQMEIIAELIAKVLRQIRITDSNQFEHDESSVEKIRFIIKEICSKHPLP